jgi:uncharacterized membrane protein
LFIKSGISKISLSHPESTLNINNIDETIYNISSAESNLMENKSHIVRQRYYLVDLLRGIAIALMLYFHFSFDLAHFGFTESDFYHDPYWLNLRTFIVSLFLFVVGISLVLATRNGIRYRNFSKRIGLLLLFSVIITLNSYFMFPGRIIIIGILHFILLASLLGLLFLRFYYLNLLLGIAIILIGVTVQHAVFDNVWYHWIGMMTHKPSTEDYVPLVPWFGVVLLGIFFMQYARRCPRLEMILQHKIDHPVADGLSFLGRHSLVVYVIHQPILYGLTWAVSIMTGH